jgi:hypothetical protein
MSMDFHQFSALAAEIMRQGYSEEQAWQFAALIGDMPVYDESGSLLVVDHQTNSVLARLKPLPFFSSCNS